MPKRKGNPEKKDLIVKQAAKLFKENGFGGTSMRELAEKVGMEAASMYNHIHSKDELLEELCFRVANQYITHLNGVENAPLSYTEKVKSLISLHIEFVLEDPAVVSVGNNDWKYLNDTKKKVFKELRKDYERRFAQLLMNGIAAGEFKQFNVSVALFTILSSLRWVELWYKPGREISGEELGKDLTSLLLTGLTN